MDLTKALEYLVDRAQREGEDLQYALDGLENDAGDNVSLSGGPAAVANSLESVLDMIGKARSAERMVAEFQTKDDLLEGMDLAQLLWEANAEG